MQETGLILGQEDLRKWQPSLLNSTVDRERGCELVHGVAKKLDAGVTHTHDRGNWSCCLFSAESCPILGLHGLLLQPVCRALLSVRISRKRILDPSLSFNR